MIVAKLVISKCGTPSLACLQKKMKLVRSVQIGKALEMFQKFVVGGWWLRPNLVFSFSLDQAEQKYVLQVAGGSKMVPSVAITITCSLLLLLAP